jgi:hypothetical protein
MHAMFSGPRNRVRRQLQLPPVRGFAMQPQPGVPRLLHLCAGSWVLVSAASLRVATHGIDGDATVVCAHTSRGCPWP